MSIIRKITEYLKYIFQKVRHNPSPQIIFDGLSNLGITIMPFYIFSEELFNKPLSHLEAGFEKYDKGFLGPEDMKKMAEIPFRNIREKTLLKRLEDGKVCFGMKYKGKLAAFTWCDLKSCHFKGCNLSLKEDEAYLFDAHTLSPFRGKGIAPYIRYHLYKEMNKLGRHRFFSISECFNAPSIKFKEKLGAKKMELGLLINLFHKWHFSFRLRKYKTRLE